ncbi:MAG: polysaccharide deacetylase family protein [Deltaproteobacteria bacterium]
MLYDTTGPYAFLGELYAIGAGNLASHFGPWTAKPVASYACGDALNYRAVIYLGSTYDEPLPTCMLDNVLATTRPVLWSYFNLWQLTNRAGAATFQANRGFMWTGIDFARVGEVQYKSRSLLRYADNGAGILNVTVSDPSRATVLANAVRADGTTFPWAVRSGNFTYVGEIPFSYMTESDRVLIFDDLMFDLLAPTTTERHRAIVRLEDISSVNDPAELRAVADLLYARHVPFGIGVVPQYRDPAGYYNGGVPENIALRNAPDVVSALQYMLTKGGTLVMHGQTHQWPNGINPFTGVTGDDSEFYRVIQNADLSLTYQGPLPGDSVTWATNRMSTGLNQFRAAGLPLPAIFEFPHYAASATSLQAAATKFTTRWERTFYFNGLISGAPISYSHVFGQLFPYVVRDIYGSRVLPENLGNVEPDAFEIWPPRLPAEIVAAAQRSLVVRDGIAGFYFHPFFALSYLTETLDGMQALGYTFVDPATLETPP